MAIKRFDQSSRHVTREAGPAADPDSLAIDALSYLANDEERLGDFLAATGLGRDALRSAAAQPGFLSGVLDYLGADEALLVAFASSRGLDPEAVGRTLARARRDVDPSP